MQEIFLKKNLESFYLLQEKKLTVAILGGGVTGQALKNFLKKKEIPYILLDSNLTCDKEEIFSDSTPIENLPPFYLILKSPGIKPEHTFLEEARKRKLPIWSEVEFARIFTPAKLVGITGTDGKSTTTALTTHLISRDFPKTKMGGNIGTSFIELCEENLDFVVLELSSYQLEDSENLQLTSATLLNIANDHLDRHKTLENYIQAKMKIFSWDNPNHTAILNSRQKIFPIPKSYSCKLQFFGTEPNDDAIILKDGIQTKNFFYSTKNFPLFGFHNFENLASAILLAESVGVNNKNIQTQLESFQGLKHRFERVLSLEGKEFINDSKSTNLHSMLAGIQGFQDEFFVLILGGIPKVEPLDPFIERLQRLNVSIYMFGEMRKTWKSELQKYSKYEILDFPNLEELMYTLAQNLKTYPPCKIIFSPAGASFDLYKNFEQRGEHFTKLVYELFGKENDKNK